MNNQTIIRQIRIQKTSQITCKVIQKIAIEITESEKNLTYHSYSHKERIDTEESTQIPSTSTFSSFCNVLLLRKYITREEKKEQNTPIKSRLSQIYMWLWMNCVPRAFFHFCIICNVNILWLKFFVIFYSFPLLLFGVCYSCYFMFSSIQDHEQRSHNMIRWLILHTCIDLDAKWKAQAQFHHTV